MKLPYAVGLLLILVSVGFYTADQSGTKPNSVMGAAEAVPNISQQPLQTTTQLRDSLVYQVSVYSRVTDEQQRPISESLFSATLGVATKGMHYPLGVLSNIEHQQNQEIQELPKQLYFMHDYRPFQFSQIDLLGLPADHSLHLIPSLLNLLSYDLDKPIDLVAHDNTQRFSYHRQGHEVTRVLIDNHHFNHVQLPVDENEQWRLWLDKQGLPEKLSYENVRVWQSDDVHYSVKQHINIAATDTQLIWPKQPLQGQLNAQLHRSVAIQTEWKITSQQSLLVALEALKANFDSDLAQQIGQYLLDNMDVMSMGQLLELQPEFASLLIYALQKVQTEQAEGMLIDLLHAPETADINKHRLAMSLGRFGQSSALGLNALKTMAEQPQMDIANTALLSLGSMAKFSQQQEAEVERYLLNNLTNSSQLAMTVLAIDNSGNEALYPYLPALLAHPSEQVKMNVVKVLTKNSHYQDQVVDALLIEGKASYFDAFVRNITEHNQGLSELNHTKLSQYAQTVSNPIIKKRLLALLGG